MRRPRSRRLVCTQWPAISISRRAKLPTWPGCRIARTDRADAVPLRPPKSFCRTRDPSDHHPQHYHVCTADGKLIYKGLLASKSDPLKWLGRHGHGQDQNGKYLIDLTEIAPPIPQDAIFLGGKTNFGHFIFEGLMRIALLSWFPDLGRLPIVVYDDLPLRYLEFLTLMGIVPERRIAISRSHPTAFASVWLLSAPLHRESPRSIPAIWPDVIWAVRQAFAHVFQPVNMPRPRYYLYRDQARWRRLTNEPKVIELLSRYKIQPINLADLGAEEQIRKVSNAEIIITPWGAGSAISVFAPVDCIIVELSPPNVSGALGSFGFAAICGRPFIRREGHYANAEDIKAAGLPENPSKLKVDADFSIDLADLERHITAAETYRKNGLPVVALPGRPVGKIQ
ncbi:MAG: glycosyltransferase family 61 protein [Alphaproteobacteria bacterium]|nr:glycosyltransferase family 61 protein [Alphaproteobacteria bacterium]